MSTDTDNTDELRERAAALHGLPAGLASRLQGEGAAALNADARALAASLAGPPPPLPDGRFDMNRRLREGLSARRAVTVVGIPEHHRRFGDWFRGEAS